MYKLSKTQSREGNTIQNINSHYIWLIENFRVIVIISGALILVGQINYQFQIIYNKK